MKKILKSLILACAVVLCMFTVMACDEKEEPPKNLQDFVSLTSKTIEYGETATIDDLKLSGSVPKGVKYTSTYEIWLFDSESGELVKQEAALPEMEIDEVGEYIQLTVSFDPKSVKNFTNTEDMVATLSVVKKTVEISNFEDLKALAEIDADGEQGFELYDAETEKFVLTDDIDGNGEVWTAIGTYGHTFFGYEFDGAGHSIKNLKYTLATDSSVALRQNLWYHVGFFGGIEKAYIHDLKLEDLVVDVSIDDHNTALQKIIMLGGLVGRAGDENYDFSRIENVSVSYTSFNVKCDKGHIGGLIGYDLMSEGAIRESLHVEGDLNLESTSGGRVGFGGVVGEGISGGYCYKDCSYKGDIKAQRVDGATPAEDYTCVGGIFGLMRKENVVSAEFVNCTVEGTITCNNEGGQGSYIGAMIGRYEKTATSFEENLSFEQCTYTVEGTVDKKKVNVLETKYTEITSEPTDEVVD